MELMVTSSFTRVRTRIQFENSDRKLIGQSQNPVTNNRKIKHDAEQKQILEILILRLPSCPNIKHFHIFINTQTSILILFSTVYYQTNLNALAVTQPCVELFTEVAQSTILSCYIIILILLTIISNCYCNSLLQRHQLMVHHNQAVMMSTSRKYMHSRILDD